MIYIVDTLEIASTFEMASVACESRRSSAYSEDLWLRMVYQREGLGVSYAEIATNVNIDQWTVKRVVKLFNDTGSCLLYTSPSPRDATLSRMPSSA